MYFNISHMDYLPSRTLKQTGVDTCLDLPRGAKWMMFGVPTHHPLRFKQHALEDTGGFVFRQTWGSTKFRSMLHHVFFPFKSVQFFLETFPEVDCRDLDGSGLVLTKWRKISWWFASKRLYFLELYTIVRCMAPFMLPNESWNQPLKVATWQ